LKKLATAFLLVLSLAGPVQAAPNPAADHHQHLFSPAVAQLLSSPTNKIEPLLAGDVVKLLDMAGIRRATILSVAYFYGSPSRQIEDEYEKVKAENDWTAGQAAAYPDRLVAFCGLNPLKDYALKELERCAKHPHLRHGIKLHIGNSDVQLEQPAHMARMQEVFKAANAHRMAIAIHLRASISRKRPYGAEQAKLFLEQLMPLAPDITVQIAHLAGAGPGYEDPAAQEAMRVFAEARERQDKHARGLWFDVASIVNVDIPEELAALVAKRLRQVGLEHVLYGTDAATGNNLRPRQSWAAFRKLPLREEEFGQIASNVAPYLRPAQGTVPPAPSVKPVSEAVELFDANRARSIPVQLSFPSRDHACHVQRACRVAFLGAGYGVPHTDYRFISDALAQRGYLVAAVRHQLPSDPALATTGDLVTLRTPMWRRGAENLRFVKAELARRYPEFDWQSLILIGHSNGGDISAFLLRESPEFARSLITLDHRRVPLPRTGDLNILSLRASDFPADPGVLPAEHEPGGTAGQGGKLTCISRIAGAQHNDMLDQGPPWLKEAILQRILAFLDGRCTR
jgi:predicted TIM-barrel fold metal-dependent hydrolase